MRHTKVKKHLRRVGKRNVRVRSHRRKTKRRKITKRSRMFREEYLPSRGISLGGSPREQRMLGKMLQKNPELIGMKGKQPVSIKFSDLHTNRVRVGLDSGKTIDLPAGGDRGLYSYGGGKDPAIELSKPVFIPDTKKWGDSAASAYGEVYLKKTPPIKTLAHEMKHAQQTRHSFGRLRNQMENIYLPYKYRPHEISARKFGDSYVNRRRLLRNEDMFK